MSLQLAKSKKKLTKKQISKSQKVFNGTADPARLDLLLPNDLTRKMKPFLQQIDLKPYGTGILLNYDQPEDSYTLVSDPCCPRTVWPEPYSCAYQRKLMIRFSEKIAAAELEKKNDTPLHFHPSQVELSGLTKAQRAKADRDMITKSTVNSKGNGPVNQKEKFDRIRMHN